jgi:hypothetical protein
VRRGRGGDNSAGTGRRFSWLAFRGSRLTGERKHTPKGGVTYSLLSRFLVCPYRDAVEGLEMWVYADGVTPKAVDGIRERCSRRAIPDPQAR